MKSWLYILSNASLGGLYKIGFSTKDPELRCKELSNTSIPEPFKLAYWCLVDDARDIEGRVHKKLKNDRVGKEFFSTNYSEIIETIKSVIDAQGKTIFLEEFFEELDNEVQASTIKELSPKEWVEANKGRMDSAQYFALLRHIGHYK